ncbi:stage II sporulation protein M [Phaeocystidibacter marisrubri]|uniref:Stage II sporulation protein M n=1 Tax=Phaeocystidibacter marisrubri TaxID=1577780 RepID=A0A6L3ZKH6_9FLAO|nr:stage II sporulation protein M [Phaeocystidibacter marisrubri]KAB2817660.1 stage II sporulation protein M [Phaeocystidibacter marisrubri]GGH74244.1 hypothetical protein GCM10011318_20020 [Phaeocystidibacter marisrubri]
MKESQFIKDNARTWAPIEKSLRTLKRGRFTSDSNSDIGEKYMRLTDDLSYAQTFYSKRSVRVYLNSLVSDVYRVVFRYSETDEDNSVKRFWIKDIPSILYHGRKAFLLSFIIFCVAMIIGAFSLSQDASFANDILSEGYVNMTEQNIEKGDPMAVYKSADSWSMFKRIAMNNLRVMTFAFLLGIFFGLGTIGALISNGVMLGVFQYFFYQRGLLWESFLTIWQHGTVEISCIIIGGGAGLMLGSGYLFPGNYSRLLSLRLQFYRGMKIALAIMPFIIFAAFVESYITRHDDMAQWIRFTFILANAAIIFGYFIYMPYRYGKIHGRLERGPDEDAASISYQLKETGILNIGEVIQNAVIKTQRFFVSFAPAMFTIITLITAGLFWQSEWLVHHIDWQETGTRGLIAFDFASAAAVGLNNFLQLQALSDFNTSPIYFGLLLSAPLALIQSIVVARFNDIPLAQLAKKAVSHFILLTIVLSGYTLAPAFLILQYVLLLPVAGVAFQVSIKDNITYFNAFFKSFKLYFSNFSMSIVWVGSVALASLLLAVLVQGSLLGVLIYFMNTFISIDNVGDPTITSAIRFFISFVTISVLFALAQIGYALIANTVLESRRADELRSQISNIQPRKKRYGIDETI